MAKKKEATLKTVAKELNTLLGLEPPIDLKLGKKVLYEKVEEAVTLLEPTDDLSEETLDWLVEEELYKVESNDDADDDEDDDLPEDEDADDDDDEDADEEPEEEEKPAPKKKPATKKKEKNDAPPKNKAKQKEIAKGKGKVKVSESNEEMAYRLFILEKKSFDDVVEEFTTVKYAGKKKTKVFIVSRVKTYLRIAVKRAEAEGVKVPKTAKPE